MTREEVDYAMETAKIALGGWRSLAVVERAKYLYKAAEILERDKEIIKNVLGDIKVEKSLDIKVGGFEIENVEKTYRLNYSLDFLLTTKYQKILANLKKEIGINN